MKIPDRIWIDQCRKCVHCQPMAGNREVPDGWMYSHSRLKDLPCGILREASNHMADGFCLDYRPMATADADHELDQMSLI